MSISEKLTLCEFNQPFAAILYSDSKDIENHWHKQIEFLYLIKGQATVFIQDDIYNLVEGDFLIINSSEVHSIKMYNSELIIIQFMPSVLNSSYASLYENKYILPFLQKKTYNIKLISLKEQIYITNILTEILDDFNNKKLGFELNIKGNLFKIFSWLISNKYIVITNTQEISPKDLDMIAILLKYLKEHYSEKITDETASQITLMSYYHFCRVFKKVTGKTFIEYLNLVRLNEAEKLIINTEKKMTDIALEVGFSNVSYFSKLFKNKKGITPFLCRKQNTNLVKKTYKNN